MWAANGEKTIPLYLCDILPEHVGDEVRLFWRVARGDGEAGKVVGGGGAESAKVVVGRIGDGRLQKVLLRQQEGKRGGLAYGRGRLLCLLGVGGGCGSSGRLCHDLSVGVS